MGWLSEIFKKLATAFLVKLIGIALFGWLLYWLNVALASLLRVPPGIRWLAGAATVILFFWLLWRLYLRRARANAMTSRYWEFFKWPLGRTSWDFECYLGVGGAGNQPVQVHAFQPKVRFNFLPGTLEEAYITSVETGERIPLAFDPGNANGDPSKYVSASKIAEMPAWMWVRTLAPLGGVHEQAFLERFGEFRLTFRVKGRRVLTHIDFRRAEQFEFFKRWHALFLARQAESVVLH